MKPQSLFLALGFLAVAVFSTRCDCNKPDDNNVTPTGCSTCTTPAECAPFNCTLGSTPKCNACTTSTVACTSTSTTPFFKGKIGGVAFETSVVKAYQYVATQGILNTKKTIIITAQNKDATGKINETYNICLDATGASPYTISSITNSRFAYLKPTGLAYADAPAGVLTLNPIGADSILSGSITSLVSNVKGQPSNAVQLSNVTFGGICFIKKSQELPTYAATATTLFEMPVIAGVATNYKASKIVAHVGEGADIGKLVIEAERNGVKKPQKFVLKIPFNILTNTSATAFKFPKSTDPTLADFSATYNDGATLASQDYTLNGITTPDCILGLITHNKEARTIVINNITLKLALNGSNITFSGGKLSAKY